MRASRSRRIYERRATSPRALAEAEAVRERAPSRQLDLYVASLRSKSGDFDGAVAFLEGAARPRRPMTRSSLYNLGVLYGEAKRNDEALGYMEQVLAVNPDHAGALNYVGYTLAERGDRISTRPRR